MTVLLDPTSELEPPIRELSARIDGLAGRTVGLLDISKPRGNVFLDRLEELLTGQGAMVRRYTKPAFSKTAPIDLRDLITTECEAVIEALAD